MTSKAAPARESNLPGRLLADLRRADELARRDTPARRMDPRAKAFVLAAFLVGLLSLERHAWREQAPFALAVWLSAAWSRTPWDWLLRQGGRTLPFVLALGLANPLWETGTAPAPWGGVWPAGWATCLALTARCLLSAWAALIFLSSTGMDGMLRALAAWRAPASFRLALWSLYQGLFALAGEAERMVRARALRGGSASMPLAEWTPLAGQLLLRTLARARRRERARVCRRMAPDDWPGQALPPADRPCGGAGWRWTWRSAGFALLGAAYCALARWM